MQLETKKGVLYYIVFVISSIYFSYYLTSAITALVVHYFPGIDSTYGSANYLGDLYYANITRALCSLFIVGFLGVLLWRQSEETKNALKENHLFNLLQKSTALFVVIFTLYLVWYQLSYLLTTGGDLGLLYQSLGEICVLIPLFVLFFLKDALAKKWVLTGVASFSLLMTLANGSFGIYAFGTPHERKMALLDAETASRMETVASQVDTYIYDKNYLPDSIRAVAGYSKMSEDPKRLKSPVTDDFFELKDLGEDKTRSADQYKRYGYGSGTKYGNYSICAPINLPYERSYELTGNYELLRTKPTVGKFCKEYPYTLEDRNPVYEDSLNSGPVQSDDYYNNLSPGSGTNSGAGE